MNCENENNQLKQHLEYVIAENNAVKTELDQ